MRWEKVGLTLFRHDTFSMETRTYRVVKKEARNIVKNYVWKHSDEKINNFYACAWKFYELFKILCADSCKAFHWKWDVEILDFSMLAIKFMSLPIISKTKFHRPVIT